MKYKHVIFDFDGTLLNTDSIIVDSWQAVFEKYLGSRQEEAMIFETFGETVHDTMSRMLSADQVDEAIQYYRDFQQANYQGRIDLYPGAKELVKDIKSAGCTVSIVTSRMKNTAMMYLRDFGVLDLFDVVVTCNDTEAHKPDPEPLEIAMEKLGANRKDAIMLGDTKYDIGCSNNAQVDSILVTWGHTADERNFGAFRPTYRAASIHEIYDIVGINRD